MDSVAINVLKIQHVYRKYKEFKEYRDNYTAFREEKRSILNKVTISSALISGVEKPNSLYSLNSKVYLKKQASIFRQEARIYIPIITNPPGTRTLSECMTLLPLLKKEQIFKDIRLSTSNLIEIAQSMEYLQYDEFSNSNLVELDCSLVIVFSGSLIIKAKTQAHYSFKIAVLYAGGVFGINPYENIDCIRYSALKSVSIFVLPRNKMSELLSKWGFECYKDTASFLVNIPGFSLLSPDELQWLSTQVAFHEIPFDTFIFSENDVIRFDTFMPILNIFLYDNRIINFKMKWRDKRTKKNLFEANTSSNKLIELCRLGQNSIFLCKFYLDLWGDEFTNPLLDPKYSFNLRQECSLITTTPSIIGFLPKDAFFLLNEKIRKILVRNFIINLPQNDDMHQLHADFKTWTKLKDKIVYDTYNNSIYERSHKILNEIKNRNNSKTDDEKSNDYMEPNTEEIFRLSIRKPMDLQALIENVPLSGSAWSKIPPNNLYKYLGYRGCHSPNNLPSIKCNVNKVKRIKSISSMKIDKFTLPSELPYISLEEVHINDTLRNNNRQNEGRINGIVFSSKMVKRNSTDILAKPPLNVSDIVKTIFSDIK